MTRKFRKATVVTAIGVLLLAGVATTVLNSLQVGLLCSSDKTIRARILERTPLGCSTNQALAFINQHHWPASSDNDLTEGTRPSVTETCYYKEERNMGGTHFYNFPFKTDVIAFWYFDENGRLIDVQVMHYIDGP